MPGTPGAWLADSTRRTAVTVALGLVPFAGIAFLWFVGVIRDRIGRREDRFFGTVFLGSGLLFVGMLFVAAAVAGGLIAAAGSRHAGQLGESDLALGRNVTSLLLNVYAMRMAAVFSLTTVTIARRTKIVSSWLSTAGLATALVLLVGVGFTAWLALLFPAWILALSIDILMAGQASRRVAPKHPLRCEASMSLLEERRAARSCAPPGPCAVQAWVRCTSLRCCQALGPGIAAALVWPILLLARSLASACSSRSHWRLAPIIAVPPTIRPERPIRLPAPTRTAPTIIGALFTLNLVYGAL